jgi:hypothetical protein
MNDPRLREILHLLDPPAGQRLWYGGATVRGSFPRSPANWPDVPKPADASHWKADRALLRSEHVKLVEAVQGFDVARLDEPTPGSGSYRFVDLLFGIVGHDLYHVGQIQVLKRLYPTRRKRAR